MLTTQKRVGHSKECLNVLKFMIKDSEFTIWLRCPTCVSGAGSQSPHLSKGRLTAYWPPEQLCSPSQLTFPLEFTAVGRDVPQCQVSSLSLPNPTWSYDFTYHTYPLHTTTLASPADSTLISAVAYTTPAGHH